MAKRIMKEGGSGVADRITYGFRLTVARPPSKTELNHVIAFYKQQQDAYSRNLDSAYKTIASTPESIANAPEVAAWTMVANVLLNADEALTKE
jgi:hypothetical protein